MGKRRPLVDGAACAPLVYLPLENPGRPLTYAVAFDLKTCNILKEALIKFEF